MDGQGGRIDDEPGHVAIQMHEDGFCGTVDHIERHHARSSKAFLHGRSATDGRAVIARADGSDENAPLGW
jgi:hypothetical protein